MGAPSPGPVLHQDPEQGHPHHHQDQHGPPEDRHVQRVDLVAEVGDGIDGGLWVLLSPRTQPPAGPSIRTTDALSQRANGPGEGGAEVWRMGLWVRCLRQGQGVQRSGKGPGGLPERAHRPRTPQGSVSTGDRLVDEHDGDTVPDRIQDQARRPGEGPLEQGLPRQRSPPRFWRVPEATAAFTPGKAVVAPPGGTAERVSGQTQGSRAVQARSCKPHFNVSNSAYRCLFRRFTRNRRNTGWGGRGVGRSLTAPVKLAGISTPRDP